MSDKKTIAIIGHHSRYTAASTAALVTRLVERQEAAHDKGQCPLCKGSGNAYQDPRSPLNRSRCWHCAGTGAVRLPR